jgi:geranylgeranyl transferase type-2 subunit alpha
MGLPLARELAYSRQKVEENFSNYSAWHYRSTLLPLLHRGGSGGGEGGGVVPGAEEALGATLEELDLGAAAGEPPAASASAAIPAAVLEEEYALVKQALYTEPEDQSGWLYHAWLLGCWAARWATAERAGGAAAERERGALRAALAAQEADCAALAAAEPRAKWPLLALARLRALRAGAGDEGGGDGGGEEARAAAEAYARLAELDPQRAGYYADAAAGRARVFGGALEGL